MASSCNVEETAVIANWGQENVQSWLIGLMYCSNFTVYFVWHEALTTRFAFFKFHTLTCWHPLLQFV